jgi:ATP-dependent DNA ligase
MRGSRTFGVNSLGARATEADGRALFEASQRLDLEGIVAKRKADPYAPGVTWYKIKNRAHTQMEGPGDLFHTRR